MLVTYMLFALCFLAIISPKPATFLGLAVLLSAAYLVATNAPITVLGIEDFVRYSKEPLILSVFIRYGAVLINGSTSGSIRRASRCYRFGPAVSIANPIAKWSLVFILLWALASLKMTGIEGFVGYLRGIAFPAILLLYVNSIDDSRLFVIARRIGLGCFLAIVLIGVFAAIHLNLDPEFGIPDSFRNRLDYYSAYQSVVEYGQVRRYQSFFGDPNRVALVSLLALWFWSVVSTDKMRWLIVPFVLAIIWTTESRAGLVVFVLWCGYLLLRRTTWKKIPFVIFVVSLVAASAGWAWVTHASRSGSVEEISRDLIWTSVANHALSSPRVLLVGEGFGWIGQRGANRVESSEIELTSASGRESSLNVIDNSFLTLLADLGLMGLIPIALFYTHILRAMSLRVGDSLARRDFFVIVFLLGVWSVFFDALISFPWTLFFPVLLRFYLLPRKQFAKRRPR